MTTRRTLLATTGAALLGAATAGCEVRTPAEAPAPGPDPNGARLLAEVADGLTVVDLAGRTVVPASAGTFNPDRTRLVTAHDGALTLYDTRTGKATDRGQTGGLSPRIVSADGALVGLTTPGTPRARTTIAVRPTAGQPTTLDLAGNLEPEAFSADGGYVYVLDYLPPMAPDRYRVRQLELATGRLLPLNTRLKSAVPPGAEEEMRGEGRQAVYDPQRRLLFTLYTHQPDHRHTRDLIRGARADAAHVHAFVHTLSLVEGWAYCVDLPAPFGERAAAGHAIALAPDSTALAVVDAATGTLATINPDSLGINATTRFTPPPRSASPAFLAYARPWEFALASGTSVVVLNSGTGATTARWSVPKPVRGLSIMDRKAYLGGDGTVAAHDLTTGRETGRTPVPGLTRLVQALPPR